MDSNLACECRKAAGAYVKYVLIFCAIFFVTINASTLAYHVVILYIYAIAIASLYFSKKLNVLTTIFSVIGVSFGQWLCFALYVFTDKNFTSTYKLFVYGIVPCGERVVSDNRGIHESTSECKEIIWKLGEASKEILEIS